MRRVNHVADTLLFLCEARWTGVRKCELPGTLGIHFKIPWTVEAAADILASIMGTDWSSRTSSKSVSLRSKPKSQILIPFFGQIKKLFFKNFNDIFGNFSLLLISRYFYKGFNSFYHFFLIQEVFGSVFSDYCLFHQIFKKRKVERP